MAEAASMDTGNQRDSSLARLASHLAMPHRPVYRVAAFPDLLPASDPVASKQAAGLSHHGFLS